MKVKSLDGFKILLTIIMFVISFAILVLFFWTIIFGVYFSSFLVLLLLIAFLPIKITQKRYWNIRLYIFIIAIILSIPAIYYSVGELDNRINYLAKKTRNNNSLISYSTNDKLGIYGLNIIMGLVGYPLFPEVAKETLLMMFPPPENGIRVFYSDFAIYSNKIKSAIIKFKNDLKDIKGEKYQDVKRISWTAKDFRVGWQEARYALALNPSYIFLNASKKKLIWVINVKLKVKIKYAKNFRFTLLPKPKLRMEEGLFWVLQKCGWLFPYTAEWRFSINSNDSRIN